MIAHYIGTGTFASVCASSFKFVAGELAPVVVLACCLLPTCWEANTAGPSVTPGVTMKQLGNAESAPAQVMLLHKCDNIA